MIIDEMSGSYRAKIDAFERGLQAKRELADRSLELDMALLRVLRDVNLEFANWLVESAERQQKAPKELLNEILTLALQAKQ
jgi:hypothetical protein